MNQNEIIDKLKELKSILYDKFGIEKFALFGSMAREDNQNNSDIDIVILKANKKDYFLRVEAKYFLEKHFNKRVDIGYFDSMRQIIKDSIKKDMIYV